MSAVGDGNFYRGLAFDGLERAAQDETSRNIQNRNIDEANKASKSQLGATIGAAAGSFIPIPVVGTVIGGVLGGLIGRKL